MTARRSKTRVRRFTVDEKLADDLIRVARCQLVEGVDEFWDRTDEWGKEDGILITPENYVRRLGIPSEEKWPWDALEEGQVFLEGEFYAVWSENETGDAEPTRFRVEQGYSTFLRIDTMRTFRDGVKAAYSAALTER